MNPVGRAFHVLKNCELFIHLVNNFFLSEGKNRLLAWLSLSRSIRLGLSRIGHSTLIGTTVSLRLDLDTYLFSPSILGEILLDFSVTPSLPERDTLALSFALFFVTILNFVMSGAPSAGDQNDAVAVHQKVSQFCYSAQCPAESSNFILVWWALVPKTALKLLLFNKCSISSQNPVISLWHEMVW